MNSKLTITEILDGSDKLIRENLDILAKDYLEKKGKKLNKGCPACVIEMVLTLKNVYMKVNFKFKRNAASYKDKKGDKVTISNSTMTDEKALKFLKTNPERIQYFSEYPENWKQLIEGKIETEKEKEARLAIEAEIEAAKEGKKEESSDKTETEEGSDAGSDDAGSDEGKVKPKREELIAKGLKVLRAEYPTIKATSTEAFVDQILAE